LEVLDGVEDELAEQLTGFGVDDAYVEIGDEHEQSPSRVFAAQPDVT
jgi:hypothetical protein